jgi:hypothetical protein
MATGIRHTTPTHGTLSGAIADERLVQNIQKLLRLDLINLREINGELKLGSPE